MVNSIVRNPAMAYRITHANMLPGFRLMAGIEGAGLRGGLVMLGAGLRSRFEGWSIGFAIRYCADDVALSAIPGSKNRCWSLAGRKALPRTEG